MKSSDKKIHCKATEIILNYCPTKKQQKLWFVISYHINFVMLYKRLYAVPPYNHTCSVAVQNYRFLIITKGSFALAGIIMILPPNANKLNNQTRSMEIGELSMALSFSLTTDSYL